MLSPVSLSSRKQPRVRSIESEHAAAGRDTTRGVAALLSQSPMSPVGTRILFERCLPTGPSISLIPRGSGLGVTAMLSYLHVRRWCPLREMPSDGALPDPTGSGSGPPSEGSADQVCVVRVLRKRAFGRMTRTLQVRGGELYGRCSLNNRSLPLAATIYHLPSTVRSPIRVVASLNTRLVRECK